MKKHTTTEPTGFPVRVTGEPTNITIYKETHDGKPRFVVAYYDAACSRHRRARSPDHPATRLRVLDERGVEVIRGRVVSRRTDGFEAFHGGVGKGGQGQRGSAMGAHVPTVRPGAVVRHTRGRLVRCRL